MKSKKEVCILDIDDMTTKDILKQLYEDSLEYEFPTPNRYMIEVLLERLENGEDEDCDDCEWNELCSGEDEIDEDLTDILSNAVQNAGNLDAINSYIQGASDTVNSIRDFVSSVLYDDEE